MSCLFYILEWSRDSPLYRTHILYKFCGLITKCEILEFQLYIHLDSCRSYIKVGNSFYLGICWYLISSLKSFLMLLHVFLFRERKTREMAVSGFLKLLKYLNVKNLSLSQSRRLDYSGMSVFSQVCIFLLVFFDMLGSLTV